MVILDFRKITSKSIWTKTYWFRKRIDNTCAIIKTKWYRIITWIDQCFTETTI